MAAADTEKLNSLKSAVAGLNQISGEAQHVGWSKIQTPTDKIVVPVGNLAYISEDPAETKKLLDKCSVPKLHGRLGTTMGCTCPKRMKDSTENPLHLTSLNHISLVCISVEESIDFCTNVLGFVPVRSDGIGIHSLQSEDPQDMREINPKDNHISFQLNSLKSAVAGLNQISENEKFEIFKLVSPYLRRMKDSTGNPLHLTSLNHISLVCISGEESIDFCTNVLGFVPVMRLFSYVIGIHLLQSEDPQDMREINPKDNHISFQIHRMDDGTYSSSGIWSRVTFNWLNPLFETGRGFVPRILRRRKMGMRAFKLLVLAIVALYIFARPMLVYGARSGPGKEYDCNAAADAKCGGPHSPIFPVRQGIDEFSGGSKSGNQSFKYQVFMSLIYFFLNGF